MNEAAQSDAVQSKPGQSEPESAELLRAYLAGRDVECPQCQYNLRDLTGDHCPECGEQILLQLRLAEPKIGTLIAGLVGLSAGAGFSGLLLLYFIIQLFVRGPQGNGNEWFKFFLLTSPGFLVEGVLVVVWIKKWGLIRRAKVTTRAALVVTCWVLSLVNLLCFSLMVR